MSERLKFLANRIALPAEPPAQIVLIPDGRNERSDGERIIVDAASAADAIAAFKAGGVDLVIDREHATLGTEIPKYMTRDGSAPAMGWIKHDQLEYVPSKGIVGPVEWTDEGAAMIRGRKYRYLSPVTITGPDDRLIGLHSAGLVNTPAIRGMPPVVNKDSLNKEQNMNEVRKALGLQDGADESAIVRAIGELRTQASAASGATALRVSVCKALAVAENVNDDSIVSAIGTLRANQANPREYVPMAQHTAMTERVTKLEGELFTNKSAGFVERGMKAGKIVEANKSMWERLYKADPAAAEKDLETSPVIAPKEGAVVPTGGGAGAAGTNGDRLMVINKAKAEYDQNAATVGQFCSRAAFVSDKLRANKLDPNLTDDEKKLVV